MTSSESAAGRLLRPAPDDAFAAYAALVEANREQVERLREATPERDGDFWAGRAAAFRPGTIHAPELAALRAIAEPDDVWLDIGAGGGRFAVPLSRHVARVIAVEPSPSMRAVLAEACAAEGRTNVDAVDVRWPPSGGDAAVPTGDVALAANVLYDVVDARAFLAAMEAFARRACVVILSDRAPSAPDAAIWETLYGEPLHALPALPEFVALLGALGRRYDVTTFPLPAPQPVDVERALDEMRWRYWVAAGSRREQRLRALLIERFGEASGLVRLPPRRNYTAVVAWPPPTV